MTNSDRYNDRVCKSIRDIATTMNEGGFREIEVEYSDYMSGKISYEYKITVRK